MYRLSLYVTLLVCLRQYTVFGGQICPTVCSCSWKEGKNVINCDRTNLTEVPKIFNNDDEDSYQDQIYNSASFNDNPLNFDSLRFLLGVRLTPKMPIWTFLSSYLRNGDTGNVKKVPWDQNFWCPKFLKI